MVTRTFLIGTVTLVVGCVARPDRDASEPADSTPTDINPPVADIYHPYYDRGERVIWRDDFTEYATGSFPRRMQLESGHIEVATIKGRNYLSSVEGGVVILVLPEVLPQLFSIEIEYDSPQAGGPFLFDTNVESQSTSGCRLGSQGHVSFVECNRDRNSAMARLPEGGLIHPRFTVDGSHVSGYINEQLLSPLPDAELPRGRRVRLHVPGGTKEHPTMISVINVAAGGRERQ